MDPTNSDSEKQATSSAEETLDRLDNLLSCYFDDELDERTVEELNDALLSDPEARKRYIDSARLHVDLTEFFRSGVGKKSVPIAPLNLPTSLDGPPVESH